MSDDSLRGTSVLVAGAGLAGLTAADALRQRGAEVTVVEARDRVGGRVWTVRDAFAGGQHAEAGGDLVDDGQRAITDLAARLGLPLTPILHDGFTFVTRRGASVVEPVREPWRQIGQALEPLVARYRLAEERLDSPIVEALARRSVAEWLDDIAADEDLRALARGLRGLFLADPDALSVLSLVEEFAEGSPGGERMYRVQGGNGLIADRLATPLGDHLQVQTALVAVSQDASKVRARVRGKNGQLAERTAHFLVVTAPAPRVATLEWTPKMPERQREAFARLRYGMATKTLLQFDRRFWQAPGKGRAYGTDLAIGAVWDANEEQAGQAGILALLAGGSASNATEALVEKRGIDGVAQELGWLGSADARPVASHATRWEDDPWSRGGYAYFDPAYAPEWRTLLGKPFGRVLFAGEHTSLKWQGYMNGAIESGLRAAEEVAAMATAR